MTEAPAATDRSANDLSDRIAGAREVPSQLESRWLLGATLAALTGRESARLHVGRYALLGELGRGGQGTVWEAEDARMGRRVALKFVQREGVDVDSTWLRQEARAMARVEHDNIAQVFDVGEHSGRPYVVMERLRGQDLRSYADGSCSDAELIEAYRCAARGLAAAHNVGVVHGDFKPSNVMVCDEGSVKVLDFGLARLGGAADVGLPLGGTPAYMAPEVLSGEPPSARSDQFSFCAALREALRSRDPGARPKRIGRALSRGLEARPGARWASMEALLAALAHGRARRVFWVGAGAITLAAILTSTTHPTPTADCQRAETYSREVWNPARAERLATAFSDATAQADNPAMGVLAWARASTKIDDAVNAWQRDYGRHCDADMHPARACLRNQLHSLDALLARWENADAQAVELSAAATAGLPGPERCSDTSVAPSTDPLDASVLAELADITALRHAGQRAEAARRAAEVLERASAASPSTYASALLIGGSLILNADPRRANEHLEASMLVSLSAGLDRLAAEAALKLMYVQTAQLREFDAAERTRRVATAALARFGGDARLEASLDATRADLALNRGRPKEAIAILESVQRRVAPLALSALFEARLLHNLALARLHLEDAAQGKVAVEELQRVVELETTAYGPTHPALVQTHNTLGLAWQRTGDWTRATESWTTALALASSSVADNDQIVALLLNNLGSASREAGDMDQAAAYLERAYDIRVASLGADHPDTALLADNLGSVTHAAGDIEAAIRWRSEALAVFEKALEPGHPWIPETTRALSATWVDWGDTLLTDEKPVLARDAYERSIALDAPTITPIARKRLAALHEPTHDGTPK